MYIYVCVCVCVRVCVCMCVCVCIYISIIIIIIIIIINCCIFLQGNTLQTISMYCHGIRRLVCTVGVCHETTIIKTDSSIAFKSERSWKSQCLWSRLLIRLTLRTQNKMTQPLHIMAWNIYHNIYFQKRQIPH